MKKLIVLAVAVALGLALNASAQVETKKDVKVTGDATKTTTEVKNVDTGAKAKQTVTTTSTETTTKTDVKGKNLKVDKEVVDTPKGEAGKMDVSVKKGAIENLSIEWTYQQKGTEYITEYTIKDKQNANLIKELKLTPEQANLITPGTHRIVSTSPFTGEDIRANLRAVILKDIESVVKAKNAEKAKK